MFPSIVFHSRQKRTFLEKLLLFRKKIPLWNVTLGSWNIFEINQFIRKKTVETNRKRSSTFLQLFIEMDFWK